MVKKSYIIAGPTASKKSDFAHSLAKKIGGTIINADSVQIYKGIENISASPLANSEFRIQNSELDGVPYRLYSVRDLSEQITVSEYLRLAQIEYEKAEIPIFVGGSGLYINALLNGMSQIPEVSIENRDRARKLVLEAPDAARKLIDFEFTDPQRMARALEVFLETGRPLSEWQKLPRIGGLKEVPLKILIMPPTDITVERIKCRLPEMLERGGMDEVKNNMLHKNRAIGIDEIGKFLSGEISIDTALENWASRTAQYAKRQRTWFRHQYGADIIIPHIPNNQDLENVLSI